MEKAIPLPQKKGGINKVDLSVIAGVVFLAVLPLFASYAISRDILIFGFYALSYAIIQGHMGQVSFGHAMYFGLGAYLTSLLLHWIPLSALARWLWVLVGVGGTTLIAYGIGRLVLLKRGAYFALTNFAFLQMFFFIIFKARSVTGGEDGFSFIPLPQLGPKPINELPSIVIYYFSFFVVAMCIFVMKRIFNDSSFGLVLHSIRENEERAQFSGYNSYRLMARAYALSGFFAAIAGALYIINLDYVGTSMIHWFLSGEAIFMVMLGGVNVFVGPILGAAIYLGIKDVMGTVLSTHWPLLVGVIVVTLIMTLKEGILGQIKGLKF